MTRGLPESHPLHRLFRGFTEPTFLAELGIGDPRLVGYVADLLACFVPRGEIWQLRDAGGRRLKVVTAMVAEAESAADHDRRRECHRHVGDFTLFWTGRLSRGPPPAPGDRLPRPPDRLPAAGQAVVLPRQHARPATSPTCSAGSATSSSSAPSASPGSAASGSGIEADRRAGRPDDRRLTAILGRAGGPAPMMSGGADPEPPVHPEVPDVRDRSRRSAPARSDYRGLGATGSGPGASSRSARSEGGRSSSSSAISAASSAASAWPSWPGPSPGRLSRRPVHPPGDGGRGRRLLRAFDPRARAVADPDCTLYEAFGVGRGGLGELFGPAVMACGFRAIRSGHGVGKVQGDPWRMPGFFLVRDGEIAWEHRPPRRRPPRLRPPPGRTGRARLKEGSATSPPCPGKMAHGLGMRDGSGGRRLDAVLVADGRRLSDRGSPSARGRPRERARLEPCSGVRVCVVPALVRCSRCPTIRLGVAARLARRD